MIGARRQRLQEPPKELLIDVLVAQAQQGLGLISQDRLDEGWKELQAPLFARKYPVRLASTRRPATWSWLAGFAAVGAAAVLAVVAYKELSARPEAPPVSYT